MASLEKLRTLIPLDQLEQSCQQQIYTELERPFLLKLAVMPDAHTGYTLPIGGVALLDSVISPVYVGYDQGCGMTFYNTGILFDEVIENAPINDCVKIFKRIKEIIPLGKTTGKYREYESFKSAIGDKELDKRVNEKLNIQLGTLGSGNHFIEIGENENDEGHLCVTIHSGSRKPGWLVANYYMKKSKLEDKHLHQGFFDLMSDFGQAFLHDMWFMLEYALKNRLVMMAEICRMLGVFVDHFRVINENHNCADLYGTEVLHRKGATPAYKDQLGVIPGNMLDGTYITRGLGNDEYLNCASHGAGRKGSRKWAKGKAPNADGNFSGFNVEDFKKEMEEAGIICDANESTLDECRGAYKDVQNVISMQEGIVVDVIDHIKPRIVVKG